MKAETSDALKYLRTFLLMTGLLWVSADDMPVRGSWTDSSTVYAGCLEEEQRSLLASASICSCWGRPGGGKSLGATECRTYESSPCP